MPPTSPPTAATAKPLRVVFFGPPRSGKSKLLDAVSAVAENYSDDPLPLRPTLTRSGPEDVIRRLVKVDLPGPRAYSGDVEFIDFDGRAAQQLLSHSDQLRRARARSQLARHVRETDALVVVVDASWSPEEVSESFEQFRTFFSALREGRALAREVGGLPVFLTLCKCDELARPGESYSEWQRRVLSETAKLEERFRDAFDSARGPFLPFGSTDLTATATATEWPEVVGGLPDETGGFGVADLHRGLIFAARDHHDRDVKSRRQLRWTAGVAVGLLAIMLVTLLVLAALRQQRAVDELAVRVQQIRQGFGPVEVRLADVNFERNRRQLRAVRDDLAFDQLPDGLQNYVLQELEQFDAYRRYRREFAPPQFSPADVRTANDRTALETALGGRLEPPAEYAEAWEKTEAVRLRQKWLSDLDRLMIAEREVHAWYTAQLARLSELLLADVPSERWSPAEWRVAVGEAVSRRPPFPESQPLPGSTALPIPRGEPITFAAAFRFERSAAAAEAWRQSAETLTDVRDLADAVGLTVDPAAPEAVLDLPLVVNRSRSLTLAQERLEALRRRFPRAAEGRARWEVSAIPGPLQTTLGKRLTAATAIGRDQVRALVSSDPAVTAGRWDQLASPAGLLSTPELHAWGELLRLLGKWSDPYQPEEDPVEHLAAFVVKRSFRWDVRRITLRLPNALRVYTPNRAGDLTVGVGQGDDRRTHRFVPALPRVGPDATTIEFTPAPDQGTIRYEPGEEFEAVVTLTDRDGAYRLRWDDVRTSRYQFEALLRPPTSETVGPNPVPVRVDQVTVDVAVAPGVNPAHAAVGAGAVLVRGDDDSFRIPTLLPAQK